MNDDDSGDETEARHLLEKRRTQAMASLARALRQNSVLRESLSPMTPPGKKL